MNEIWRAERGEKTGRKEDKKELIGEKEPNGEKFSFFDDHFLANSNHISVASTLICLSSRFTIRQTAHD